MSKVFILPVPLYYRCEVFKAGAADATSAVISEGTFATGTPTAANAAILSAAVPEPPVTIAPA
jgi:hypothetical protein